MEEPKFIEGGLSVDDRGEAIFANAFQFKDVKRFYIVRNHRVGFVRAWHGHKNAGKYVLVCSGAALVGAVAIENWQAPDPKARVYRFVLSAKKPVILYIPPGYANGAMSLTVDTQIIYFATDTLEETAQDDYRYNSRHWDIWQAEER